MPTMVEIGAAMREQFQDADILIVAQMIQKERYVAAKQLEILRQMEWDREAETRACKEFGEQNG